MICARMTIGTKKGEAFMANMEPTDHAGPACHFAWEI